MTYTDRHDNLREVGIAKIPKPENKGILRFLPSLKLYRNESNANLIKTREIAIDRYD